jgi:hypothetical protein
MNPAIEDAAGNKYNVFADNGRSKYPIERNDDWKKCEQILKGIKLHELVRDPRWAELVRTVQP